MTDGEFHDDLLVSDANGLASAHRFVASALHREANRRGPDSFLNHRSAQISDLSAENFVLRAKSFDSDEQLSFGSLLLKCSSTFSM